MKIPVSASPDPAFIPFNVDSDMGPDKGNPYRQQKGAETQLVAVRLEKDLLLWGGLLREQPRLRGYWPTHSDFIRDAYFKYCQVVDRAVSNSGEVAEPVGIKLLARMEEAERQAELAAIEESIGRVDAALWTLLQDYGQGQEQEIARVLGGAVKVVKRTAQSSEYWGRRLREGIMRGRNFSPAVALLERGGYDELVEELKAWR